MTAIRKTLDELLEDLPDELLDEERLRPPSKASRSSEHEFFERINAFIDEHGREPDPKAATGSEERKLGINLKGTRRNSDLATKLRELDRHSLLSNSGRSIPAPVATANVEVSDENDLTLVGGSLQEEESSKLPTREFSSIDEILGDDELMALLDTSADADDVYEITHVDYVDRSKRVPDEIADREICQDFEHFEPLFQRMRERIAEDAATVEPFHHSGQIEVGDYFFLRGQMCLVDSVEATENREEGEVVYRVRVIFDNGMEMTPYKHSLGRALIGHKTKGYERGQRILDPEVVEDRFNGITHRDQSRGFIYVLRSKRTDTVIREQRDLYKIGLTSRSIDDRLQGAEFQKTYLEGPIELVAEWEIYGANLKRVEKLLHAFLAPRRAAFSLIDTNGRSYHPREWFNVPFLTIKQTANAIMDNTLMEYRLNPINGDMVHKEAAQALDDRNI
ncbi:MAG: GIY-YIG nuclease family protein [Halomonas sp.]|nr:GIY-YIG nuclease family protein [Halomonas sp.]MBR2513196.1 GIY-YIG nuclease family protein [Halomonas sp.]